MGQVWLAFDPVLSRSVAIKLVHADTGASGQAHLERLAREARALARLSHPNVVGVFDVGTYAIPGEDRYQGLYIVMELVVGPTLARWLATPRRVDVILDVFVQAAHGLAAAHDAGLVHRDFKPANVLVGDDGRVRVGDFGLARRGAGEGGDARAIAEPLDARAIVEQLDAHELIETLAGSLTDAGTVIGTPLYMSPEQHRGETADATSDQYAFCVALYEALAGVRPFVGDLDRAYAAKCARLVAPPAAGREVPRRLLEVVMRGLASDRDGRWPSMRALVAALRPAAPRRRTTAVAVGSALALLGLAAAIAREEPGIACADRARIDAAWDDGARRAVTASVSAADSPEQARRVVAALDGQVDALHVALDEHCGAPPTAASACLRDVTTQLVTTVEVLAVDERAAVEASGAVAALPEASSCARAVAGAGATDPRLVAVRDRETVADALWNANQVDAGLAAAQDAREAAWALGELGRPAAVRLSLRIARMHDTLGEAELARAGFSEAYFAASEIGDHDTAAIAAMRTALLFAEDADLEGTERWARDAEANLARAELEPCEAHQFETDRGLLAALAYDFEVAERLLRDAVDGCGALRCGERCVVATANLAQILNQLVRDEEALAYRREVVAQFVELRGPESLPTAEARVNLAQSLVRLEAFDEALAELALAEAVLERRGGPSHPRLASAAMLRSQTYGALGDFTGAVEAAERAVAIGALHMRRDNPQHIGRVITLANAVGDAGDPRRALELYDGVLFDVNEPNPAHGLALIARGYTRMEAGDLVGALDDARRGRALLERYAPRDARHISLSYQNEADALVRQGACAEADRVVAAGIEWADAEALDGARRELTDARAVVAATCRERGP
jgi:tetratricopeptide (TPR) repeat protein